MDLQKLGDHENFLDDIVFSDESSFDNNGLANRHIIHYYCDENPNFFRTVDRQHQWSVNVWDGIVGKRMTGPHFLMAT